jgi:hypothetical protein
MGVPWHDRPRGWLGILLMRIITSLMEGGKARERQRSNLNRSHKVKHRESVLQVRREQCILHAQARQGAFEIHPCNEAVASTHSQQR